MKKSQQWVQEEIGALKRRAYEAGRSIEDQMELELAVHWDLAEAVERVYLEVAELEVGKDWPLRGLSRG